MGHRMFNEMENVRHMGHWRQNWRKSWWIGITDWRISSTTWQYVACDKRWCLEKMVLSGQLQWRLEIGSYEDPYKSDHQFPWSSWRKKEAEVDGTRDTKISKTWRFVISGLHFWQIILTIENGQTRKNYIVVLLDCETTFSAPYTFKKSNHFFSLRFNVYLRKDISVVCTCFDSLGAVVAVISKNWTLSCSSCPTGIFVELCQRHIFDELKILVSSVIVPLNLEVDQCCMKGFWSLLFWPNCLNFVS